MFMISEMFERLNLPALVELLRFGTSDPQLVSTGTYEQRLRDSEKEFLEKFGAFGLDTQLSENIMNVLFSHQGDTNDIYFELGMKVGIALYRKLVEGLPADVQAAIDKAVE